MAKPTTIAERHFYLWQQREKRLSHLVFGTLLFAVLGAWKVVWPSTRNATEHAQLEARTGPLALELERENARLEALAPVMVALARVDESMRAEPWRQVIEDFKADFAALRSADELVKRDLEQARRLLTDPRFSAHFAEGRSRRDPSQFDPSLPRTEQLPTHLVETLNTPNTLAPPRLPEGVDNPAVAGLASLDLDRNAARTAAPADLVAQIGAAMGRRVEFLAREKVAAIANSVAEHVSKPLEAALLAVPTGGLDFRDLRASLAENSQRMDQWARDRIADPEWYRTIESKGATITDLGDVLGNWKYAFAGILDNQRQALEAARQRVTDSIAKIEVDKNALRTRQTALRDQVKELLPTWVRGFVTPAELARTYPIVLAALGALIFAMAGLVRHHFLCSRVETYGLDATRTDAALSSCWTLVFRGWRGTVWTLVTWVAVCVGWWWFTRDGLTHASMLWSNGFLGEPLGNPQWLDTALLSLWLAPPLAVLGFALVLLDSKKTAKPSAPTTSKAA